MYSLQFPNIFKGGSTNLLEDKEAAISNLKLVLTSEKTGLYGDPDFGTNLKRWIFNLNSKLLRDLLIDEIYTCIREYVPQLVLERKDILIMSDKSAIYAEITCRFYKDTVLDTYSIKLAEE